MARVSVVVPVYNVEAYLRECLESVATQSFKDLEVIMVDDGSTDGSVAICEEFAARDERFKLVRQPNGGLGNARNNGAKEATGEFLCVPGLRRRADQARAADDDPLARQDRLGLRHRQRLPLQPRRRSRRRRSSRARSASRGRRRTSRSSAGCSSTASRPTSSSGASFWDQHGFAFPEGVVHEDIPVILPAHFLAKSVDVISEPVYLYRLRETGGLSITQRRLERKVLHDRLAAVSHVSRFLKKHKRRAKRWYDTSVVGEDLRYHVNVLPFATEDDRRHFLDEVNRSSTRSARRPSSRCRPSSGVKWALVRARRMDELLEVIRFQKEDFNEAVPVAIGGRWYGGYPFLERCEELGVPRSAYELRQELTLSAQLDAVRWEGDVCHIDGSAFITAIGTPEQGAQSIRIVALRVGKSHLWRRVRRKIPWLGIRVHTETGCTGRS